jgi:hypothetical protein
MGFKMVQAYTVPNHPLNNRRWEDRIIIGRKQIGWKGVDWLNLAQDRDNRDKERELVNSTKKLQAPYKVGNLTE